NSMIQELSSQEEIPIYLLELNQIDSSEKLYNSEYFSPILLDLDKETTQLEEISFDTIKPFLKNLNILSVYPNPFKNIFFISYFSEASERISISIIDIYGNILSERTELLHEGKNDLKFNLEHKLPSGIYFIRFKEMSTDHTVFTKIAKQ